ncbi:D-alanyl-D-alanine carboxypeptidase family protein [Actinocorallia sp. A-T 12471]|uniref:D-alanyl-D-alanine carboxypeptidase family protein n=1 Tax=Actinocorallia sp. A-T 12471 TaxID=3089813 RepID=UPI0029D30E72|nr:D-alanyl-D-alanine carboxypeptidase family protein [Actinocorallia sp. A-T 12471]MDX6738430.1 D-alanyl-D-alanine carboxypeptidase family protein [Actinocorallia sp. A-T 12471]
MVVASPGVAAVKPSIDQVENLRKQATKARNELQGLDKELKGLRKEVRQSKKRLRETLAELAKADEEFDRIRGPLAQLANSAYQAPAASGALSIFGPGSATDALHASADVTFLAGSDQALIDAAEELRDRREDLADDAQDLQSRTNLDQAKIKKQQKTLFKRVDDLKNQLNKMLKNLDLDRDTELTLRCDESLVEDSKKFPNGLIPGQYLCKIPQQGFLLRADAALSFVKLNAAYKKRFGVDMCVRDAYRDLAEQQRLYYARPGFAAIPGHSNHGLGQALDLCGGVQTSGSVQFTWLEANAGTYGWFHPSWAYSSPFEPWHWEFGTQDR